MSENNKRTLIYIDGDDFKTYQKLLKSHFFKNKKNIDLFACATLVGVYYVKEPKKLNKSSKKDYIRVNDNKNKDSMVILKSIAISGFDNVNVLIDEDKLFEYCEGYANSGIKQLDAWYEDKEHDFHINLTKVLLKFWKDLKKEGILEKL